jgi:endonuclease-3 related protein
LPLFFQLLRQYGEPGPWPWFGSGHRHTPEEIAIGAILTQNVSWRNVEIAINNLRQAKLNNLPRICQLGVQKNQKKLKQLIRPAGFYNQKAKYLFEFSKFITENFGSLSYFFKQSIPTARGQLLKVHGIGPETADTILLYVGAKPIFVIDAYTKKFIKHHRLRQNLQYHILQKFFMDNLPKNAKLYQDYHALIVKWGKGISVRHSERSEKSQS